MAPITEKEKAAIIKNITEVVRTSDIQLLSKKSYDFLYLASGFIAHYDHSGFKSYYEHGWALRRDIFEYRSINQWDNFYRGEKDYEYYMSKKDLYNRICAAIESFDKPKAKINPMLLSFSDFLLQEGFQTQLEAVQYYGYEAVVPALCKEGCEVEPDGRCSHGCPSVLLLAGVI